MAAKKKKKLTKREKSLIAKKGWVTRRKRYELPPKQSKRAKRKKPTAAEKRATSKRRSEAQKEAWERRHIRKRIEKEKVAAGIKKQNRQYPVFSRAMDEFIDRFRKEKNPKKKEELKNTFVGLVEQIAKEAIVTQAKAEERDTILADLRMRGLLKDADIADIIKDFVETNDSVIMTRMRIAEVTGREYDEAKQLAIDFDRSVQSIYSLFMGSP
jgi:uncharacterized protein YihD (DUF1040 family)